LAKVFIKPTDGLEDTGEVDPDHVVPLLVGEILAGRGADDPGVGQNDVEATEFGDTFGECRLEGGAVADVGLRGDDPRSSASTWRTVSARSSDVASE
jgi:hypothetical protein